MLFSSFSPNQVAETHVSKIANGVKKKCVHCRIGLGLSSPPRSSSWLFACFELGGKISILWLWRRKVTSIALLWILSFKYQESSWADNSDVKWQMNRVLAFDAFDYLSEAKHCHVLFSTWAITFFSSPISASKPRHTVAFCIFLCVAWYFESYFLVLINCDSCNFVVS